MSTKYNELYIPELGGSNNWFGSLVSGIYGGLDMIGLGTHQRDMAYEAIEAEKQRDWQTQMSNTAVQRQVADMEKAGINPAMAFANNAGGANTPNGGMAHAGANVNGIGQVLNGMANVANSMNYDNNKNNDTNVAGIIKLVSTIANIMK